MSNQIKFDRTRTLAFSKSLNRDDNTIYFPTDSDSVVIGAKEYGCTSAVASSLATLYSQISTANEAAGRAEAAAEDASESLADLQTTIQNLPDGSAVSAQVGLMQDHKAEIIDLRGISTDSGSNIIKDSNGNSIDAGKCHFVYSKEVSGALRYRACETAIYSYHEDYHIIVKARVEKTQEYPHNYKYWVFNSDYPWLCTNTYNEDDVPANYKNLFPSNVMGDKLDYAYYLLDLGSQSNFTPESTGSSLGYYSLSKSGMSIAGIRNTLHAYWQQGIMPILSMTLSSHSATYTLPMCKAGNDYIGSLRGNNGDYTVRVVSNTTSCKAYIEAVGNTMIGEVVDTVEDE